MARALSSPADGVVGHFPSRATPAGAPAKTGVTVELSNEGDSAEVTSLLKASYSELMRPAYDAAVLQKALPAMVRANPMLLRSGTYYVARQQDGLVVGCGGWSFERPGTTQIDPGTGHVRHFAVQPNWIGQGIGRQIYRACAKQALSRGIAALEVFASLNAVPFYAQLGFVKLQMISVAMGPELSFPSVWMRRSISV